MGIKFVDLQDKFLFKILVAVQKKNACWLPCFGWNDFSLRKHPLLLALRRWGRLADERNTSPKSTRRHAKMDKFIFGTPWLPDSLCKHWLRHQYGVSVAESQTFLLAKRPQRWRARRNGCFRRLEWFGRLKRWGNGFESSIYSFSQDLEDVFENHHLVYCLFCLCC